MTLIESGSYIYKYLIPKRNVIIDLDWILGRGSGVYIYQVSVVRLSRQVISGLESAAPIQQP
jgi:hypothetical protein